MKMTIQDKSFEELTDLLRMFPLMRAKLQTLPLSAEERSRKLKRLFEAEFANQLALLYYGYRYDFLEDILGQRDPHMPTVRGCRVDFGGRNQRAKCMRYLYETLVRADLRAMVSNTELVFRYDDMMHYMKRMHKKNTEDILYDGEFWNLYFAYYEEYQRTEESLIK